MFSNFYTSDELTFSQIVVFYIVYIRRLKSRYEKINYKEIEKIYNCQRDDVIEGYIKEFKYNLDNENKKRLKLVKDQLDNDEIKFDDLLKNILKIQKRIIDQKESFDDDYIDFAFLLVKLFDYTIFINNRIFSLEELKNIKTNFIKDKFSFHYLYYVRKYDMESLFDYAKGCLNECNYSTEFKHKEKLKELINITERFSDLIYQAGSIKSKIIRKIKNENSPHSNSYEGDNEYAEFISKNNEIQKSDSKLYIKNINTFKQDIKKHIIGQDKVIDYISDSLISQFYHDKLFNRTKPFLTFFFAGPTGVGKTEMSKQIAKLIYGSDDKLVKFDMSEYVFDPITKLIGSTVGYIGSDSPGSLIKAINKHESCVLLFDEIEKADKKVFDIFLQILDEGIVTDNKGNTYNLKDYIIIFTSNIGSNKIEQTMDNDIINEIILSEIDTYFRNILNRVEILSRIGKNNILSFNLIHSKNHIDKIFTNYLSELQTKLLNFNVLVEFEKEKLYDFIIKDLDTSKGVRSIQDKFQILFIQFVLFLNRKSIYLDDNINKKLKIIITYNNNKLKFEKKEVRKINDNYYYAKIVEILNQIKEEDLLLK